MKRTTQLAAMTILAFSGLAFAAAPDDTTSSDDKQALKGPRVQQQQGAEREQRRMRGGDGELMERGEQHARAERDGARRAGTMQSGQQIREMLAALRALKNADGDLALSEGQEAQIKKISEEHRAAVKAYMEEHKSEIESIRAELKPGEDGERLSPEARKAAMEKVKAIMDASPADGSAKQKIMDVLSVGQQDLVKATIEKQRERLAARQKRAAQRGGEGGERPARRDGAAERPEGADAARERRAPEGDAPAPRRDRPRPAQPVDD